MSKERHITFADVIRFGKTTLKYLKSGGRVVSQEEAERRAEICTACEFNNPKNKDEKGCLSCIAKKIYFAIRKRTPETSLDDKLTFCKVCNCELKIKVHLPLSAIDNEGIIHKYPWHCWQLDNPDKEL